MNPQSINGVLVSPEGDLLLMLNDQDQWVLPGGNLKDGEDARDSLARQFHEQLGLRVSVLGTLAGEGSAVETRLCELSGEFRPRLDLAVKRIGLFSHDRLPAELQAPLRAGLERLARHGAAHAGTAVGKERFAAAALTAV
ncbi:NUDIX domain-containing protein [Paludibacterium paludis]|uniref:Nudix hydrolase domain-containing protein n=1 Tax=Paludibacterium paludis TaxID=1225769 RepID=A0A918NWY1_9NEIS|nr:NUDIX domain-containing protein [Paludibacterium paludis]GGY03046.1 hypothetical protein GCM10011289_01560 [Paludibacterium paludis]